MNTTEASKKNSPWFLLWIPPVLFLLVIVLFSIYFGAQARGDTNVIAEKTTEATPYILLTVQLLLLVIQFMVFRRQGPTMRDLGWQVTEGKAAWKELAIGAVIGAPLGVLWIYVIEPSLSTIQSTVGDYVPAGSLFPALGAAIIPFAIAFGLLHWSGGFWYILTTAILVGIPFAILRLRRGNIFVYCGHPDQP